MDKLLSELEKQRRAESIYYSRRNINNFSDNIESKDKKNIYKLLFRILVFVNLIIVFFGIQNKEYVFKEEFISDVNILFENIKKRAGNNMIVYENEIENDKSLNENSVNMSNIQEINEENITNVNENVEKVLENKEKTEEEKEIEALIGMYQFKKPIENERCYNIKFWKEKQ